MKLINTLGQAFKKLENSKFFNKTVYLSTTYLALLDIKKSFIIAVNSSQSLGKRIIAFTRGASCSISLATLYFSEAIGSPKLQAFLRAGCAR